MKPGPNYRMSPLLKISLATGKFTDAHQRGAWKRACIDAELCAAIQPKREKRPAGPGGYAKNPTGTASTRN
jgi:hypothetical protein